MKDKSDRELLELAAKAAATFITEDQFRRECKSPWDPTWEPTYNDENNTIVGWRTWYGSNGEIGGWEGYEWSPLTDDGDALRLAVKLVMSIEVSDHEESTYAYAGKVPRVYAMELWRDDKSAATRRAIVRAAAAAGEEMP
jgi:hypothetical protein